MYKTTKDSRHILNYANDVNSTLDKKAQLESLKNEVSKHKEKIQSLENKFRDVKYINNSLYSRLDRISEKESEKKKFLSELFNLIEGNKTTFPEGDYITMCNLFKNLYE